jgi:hypothetical protein
MNADGSGQTRLTTDAAGDSQPAWSGNGQRIVAVNASGGSYVMNADGGSPVSINGGDYPSWSADGTRIAFLSGEDIISVKPDGTDLQTHFASYSEDIGCMNYAYASDPLDWSPDSAWLMHRAVYGDIVCSEQETGYLEIYPVREAGSGIFYGGPGGMSSVFSPDGTKVATGATDTGSIFVTTLGGSNRVRVATGDDPNWQPIPPQGYARPRAAQPTTVRLVPAYEPCANGNAVHGEPLAASSCHPPVQQSDYVTVGTGEGETAAQSAGLVYFDRFGESPINFTNGDQADVVLNIEITDVRKMSDRSDYPGELRVGFTIRMTDRDSSGGPASASVFPSTALDVAFGFSVGCVPTSDDTVGSTCSAATTADAVLSGVVKEGKRTIWELGRVEVYDGGADGDADTTGDNTLFATQGLFVP